MPAPDPVAYQPPLTWRAETWRLTLAAVISALIFIGAASTTSSYDGLLVTVDVVLGLASFGLVRLRRRWPLAVATVLAVAGMFSLLSAGPAVLAAVSLATRRVLWQIGLVGTLSVAAGQLHGVLHPTADPDPWWLTFTVGVAFTVAVSAWGMLLGSRRELIWTLREQVRRAATEQELRLAQGKVTERARIAREMHDVLAHRISLITLHAGALAYREDLTGAEIRETAELIQTKSHEALRDLRQVLGVLRGDQDSLEAPQPTLRDLGALILEAEQSGMNIAYRSDLPGPGEPPEQVARTAYRIVQEGLTNARKHAPGTTVLVAVSGSPGVGLSVRIRNPARSNAVTGPGAGLGLIGLDERAVLAGGRVHTDRRGGTFELQGWLPWS